MRRNCTFYDGYDEKKMRLQSKDTLWLRKELYSCCLLGWSEWMAISLQQPTMQAFSWVTWVPEFPRVVVHVSKGAAFYNRPFPSSKNFHFQNEAKCKTFLLKMTFIFMTIKSHFYINGFALRLALKERLGATWKWPITPPPPGGTPFFGLCGCVPLNRVWFSRSWVLNRVYNFTIERLEQGLFLDWKPFKGCEDLRWAVYICSTNNFFP